MGEVVSAHAVLIRAVADDGLHGRAALHLLFDCRRHAAFLSLCEDAEYLGVRGVVVSVSGFGEYLLNLIDDQFLHAGDHVFQGVTVLGVAWKNHGNPLSACARTSGKTRKFLVN